MAWVGEGGEGEDKRASLRSDGAMVVCAFGWVTTLGEKTQAGGGLREAHVTGVGDGHDTDDEPWPSASSWIYDYLFKGLDMRPKQPPTFFF